MSSSSRSARPFWHRAFLAVILGFLCLTYLGQARLNAPQPYGYIPLWDPDALLHLRRMEQVVLSQGAVPVLGTDTYSFFHGDGGYPYAPLLDWLGVYSYWLYNAVFSGAETALPVVAGWVPPVLGCLMVMLLFLWAERRSGSIALGLFVGLQLLGDPFLNDTFLFLRVDHHCLEGFLLWSFLLVGVSASGSEKVALRHILAGSFIWMGMLTAWNGSPLLTLVIGGYAVAAALFAFLVPGKDPEGQPVGVMQEPREPWEYRLLEFVSVTFLISGLLMLYFGWRTGLHGFSIAPLSLFQPVLTSVAGMLSFLLLKYVRMGGKIGWVLLLAGIVSAFLGKDIILSGLDSQFSLSPFFSTITEQQPLFSFAEGNVSFFRLITYFGWQVFLVPLGYFVTSATLLKNEGRFLNHLGVLFFLLGITKQRYLRWSSMFLAIWVGVLLYELFKLSRTFLGSSRRPLRSLALLLCFSPLVIASLGFPLERVPKGLAEGQADFINAMAWLQANSPEAGGYGDNQVPKYCVLCFWDLGNAVSYYSKRPGIPNSLQFGLNYMSSIFSAPSESEAYRMCNEAKVRYWVLTPASTEDFAEVIPVLQNTSFSGGYMGSSEIPENWQNLPKLSEKNLTHGKLFRYLGLGNKSEESFSHFRLIYLSRSALSTGHPWLKIFQIVKGARIFGKAPPETEMVCSLPVSFPFHGKQKREFWKRVKTGADGSFEFVVPYPTDHKSGGIVTGKTYEVHSMDKEKPFHGEIQISPADVEEGHDMSCRPS